MPQFKIIEVVSHSGGFETGRRELDNLLAAGWQVYDVDDTEEWSYPVGSGDEAHARCYKYKLRKD